MKKRKSISTILTSCAFVVVSGCDHAPITKLQIEQARENGLIVYCNGFLSDETRRMTREIAGELDMCYFPDRRDIRGLLEDGENSQYGNHIVFHSAGSDNAYDFSNWCRNSGIEIRTVHSLDAFTSHNFQRNAGTVHNYFSSLPYAFGKESCRGGVNPSSFTTIPNSNHLNLPWKSKSTIKNRIISQRRDRVYQRIPTRSGR
jgi:hypothetical protein